MLQLLTIARQIRAEMTANVEILIGEATCASVNPDTLTKTAAVRQTITYQLLVYIFVHINNANSIITTVV